MPLKETWATIKIDDSTIYTKRIIMANTDYDAILGLEFCEKSEIRIIFDQTANNLITFDLNPNSQQELMNNFSVNV